jgi:2-phosphosulfolactate phosphatase
MPAARACYAATADLAAAATDCASGRELTERGFADDVAIATEADSCHLIPVLTDRAFSAAG